MQLTPKLNLKKPDLTDSINVQDLNDNMDVLDTAVSELQEGSASIPDLETNDKTLAGAINELKQTVNDVGTNAQQQLKNHEVDYVKHPGYGVTTFSSPTYSVTLSPAPTQYIDGMGLVLRLNADQVAGNAAINVNGIGAKNILNSKGFSVTNLKKDAIYSFRYSAAKGAFILQGESEVEVGKQIITPSTVNKAITAGVHDGTGYVEGSPNLIPANIKKGANIFGVVGDASTYPVPSHGTTIVGGVYGLSQYGGFLWTLAKTIKPNFSGNVTLIFDLAKYAGNLNDNVMAYVSQNGTTIGQANYTTNSSSPTVFTINTTIAIGDILRLYITNGTTSTTIYVNNMMFMLAFGGTPPLGVFEKNY